jgi:hypothetical protein
MKLAETNPLIAETIREMPKELAGIAASTYDEIVGRLMAASTNDARFRRPPSIRRRRQVQVLW